MKFKYNFLAVSILSQFKSRTILFLVFLVLTSNSCKKGWLDEKAQKTQAVPESLKDYQALLDYSILINAYMNALGEVASDGHYISESVWSASANPNANNAYTWSQPLPYRVVTGWNSLYNKLFNVNLVLDGLKKVNAVNSNEENQKNHIRSQALFLKAEIYYGLSQIYAQPYDPATAVNDQGIVVQENSDFTQPVKRVTVQKTYELILEYLNEAIVNLPPTPKVPTRASLPAAYALLARTYMSMLNYEKALIYADKSFAINNALMDFNDLSPNANSIGQFNKEVLFHDLLYTSDFSGFITSGSLIDQTLYNSYDNNDLRKTIFFKQSGTSITFKGNYNNSVNSLFCGLATDEVYLMRAECNARKGNTAEAMNDLNNLLRSRWKKVSGISTYTNQTATNADEALIKILTERKKELVLRGLRWADLRRLNKEDRFKITITRNIGGQIYTLPPNSYKYTFPIPADILEVSSIPQTVGW